MSPFLLLAHFLLGLIIGSFLNVVIIRHSTGRSLAGRSGCMACKAKLEARQLVPVLSWLWQLGRCAVCGSRISPIYPVVELVTAFSFVAVYMLFPIMFLSVGGVFAGVLLPLFLHVVALCIVCFAILIAVYDIRHTIIPDAWSYGFSVSAFAYSVVSIINGASQLGWGELLVAGPIVAAPLAAMWLFSGGRWMGLGDAKLALGIGWLLGIGYGFAAVMGAFVIGAIIGTVLLAVSSPSLIRVMRRLTPMYVSRKLQFGFTIKSEVPFGPFLIVSCFLVWFLVQSGFYIFMW